MQVVLWWLATITRIFWENSELKNPWDHSFSHHQQRRVDFKQCWSFPAHREEFADLMTWECSYYTKNWEVLGKSSPPHSRFPSTLETSLVVRPRTISRASGSSQYLPWDFLEHGYSVNSCAALGSAKLITSWSINAKKLTVLKLILSRYFLLQISPIPLFIKEVIKALN